MNFPVRAHIIYSGSSQNGEFSFTWIMHVRPDRQSIYIFSITSFHIVKKAIENY